MKEVKNDLIVAIPLRNAVYEIEELVKNILNTNKSSIIFYISDNFSNDGTRNILERLQKDYPNIKCFFQKNNIGRVENFHFLLEEALKDLPAEYFCWLSHDDTRPSGSLDKMIDHLKKRKDLIGVASHVTRLDKDLKKLTPFIPRKIIYEKPQKRLISEWRRPMVTKFYGVFRLSFMPSTKNMYTGDYHDQIYLDKLLSRGKIDVIEDNLFIYKDNGLGTRESNCKFIKSLPKLIKYKIYKFNHFMYFFETFKTVSSISNNIFEKFILMSIFIFNFIKHKFLR